MEYEDFEIGQEFYCAGQAWRCTDKGMRVIIAIQLDNIETVTVLVKDGITGPEQRQTLTREQAEKAKWFGGPPYAVAECVFDEYDIGGCALERQEPIKWAESSTR